MLVLDSVSTDRDITELARPFLDRADARLASSSEAEMPPIQAWRRAFAQLGLKPTQYRCASEALLRRYRKDGSLPPVHPLVDLCNAASLATAIPVAVFDLDCVQSDLAVRYATGTETYLAFSGDVEHPAPGEVVFADSAAQTHARRWTNRQSARSAVRDSTTRCLVVAEALHDTAAADIAALLGELQPALADAWAQPTLCAQPTAHHPLITIP